MRSARRSGVLSLLVLALVSGGVLAEAEYNYASVTNAGESTASVLDASRTDDGLRVRLSVENELDARLDVEYIHVEADHVGGVDEASVPYDGRRTLPPGETTLVVRIPERQLSDPTARIDRATVRGTVAVSAFNGYEFEIPINPKRVNVDE